MPKKERWFACPLKRLPIWMNKMMLEVLCSGRHYHYSWTTYMRWLNSSLHCSAAATRMQENELSPWNIKSATKKELSICNWGRSHGSFTVKKDLLGHAAPPPTPIWCILSRLHMPEGNLGYNEMITLTQIIEMWILANINEEVKSSDFHEGNVTRTCKASFDYASLLSPIHRNIAHFSIYTCQKWNLT